MKPTTSIFRSRLFGGVLLSLAGFSAHAAYLTGSAAIVDIGGGTRLSGGILSLEPSVAADLVQTNPSGGGSFAAITTPTGFANFPLVSFNSTLNLNGVATVTGPAAPQTAESITNLFDVGQYQFNLVSLGVAAGGAVFGTGEWVDTSNALAITGGLFTLSTSSNWTSYSGTYAATGAAPVPLPASAWLMLSSIGGFALLARGRRRN